MGPVAVRLRAGSAQAATATMSTSVVGIDPSSKSVAAVVLNQGKLVRASKIEFIRKGAWKPSDSRDIQRSIVGFIRHSLKLEPGDRVYLEEPVVGRSPKSTIVQSYVSGILQAKLSTLGCQVVLVNNKTWKKAVVGNGNASKEDTQSFLGATYPRAVRSLGSDDDLHDAFGLAIYGAGPGSRVQRGSVYRA